MTWKTLLLIIMVLLIFLLYVYAQQRRMIYFPDKSRPSKKEYQAEDFETVQLQTKDGLSLLSWFKRAQTGRPTVVYFHGNGGHIGYRAPVIRPLVAMGYGLLLVEYRGYGGNEGRPTETGLYHDGEAAVNFLRQQGIASNQIVLFGVSLGSGVAVEMASRYPVCALVLKAPIASLAAVAAWHYPWVWLKPWDKYDNLQKIPELDLPLLIYHSQDDAIVPYQQGLLLFRKANQPKEMVSSTDGGHNHFDDEFFQIMDKFLKSHCH